MINLSISIDETQVINNKNIHFRNVEISLADLASKVPGHSNGDFKSALWSKYKKHIWKLQNKKCAYCEARLDEPNCHLEHFRPKSKVMNIENVEVTRMAYWWLAYEEKNYLVSCLICNLQKGAKFPLENEIHRVLDATVEITANGQLGLEEPLLINPRFEEKPGSSFTYELHVREKKDIVFVKGKNARGKASVICFDINRRQTNSTGAKSMLPIRRAEILNEFRSQIYNLEFEMQRYELVLMIDDGHLGRTDYIDLKRQALLDKIENIKHRFLSDTAEFAGLCRWWVVTQTNHEDRLLPHD